MQAEFPEKLGVLFDESPRYIVLHGGRGGSKSWGVARALLLRGKAKPLRILCARETMQSMADSVHQLLDDQIKVLGLQDFYQVLKSSIVGANGTEFAFAGLRHNITQIKSYESFDIAWVEEAASVSKASWSVLIPTIRRPGSQIIATFNPELETDDTYQRFVINPPPNAKVVQIGWRDNPWFPEVLRQEMEHLKATDEDAYNHVWEGCCIQNVEGAIYAAELRQADREGRITRVPYDPLKPVHTFWDLGWGDSTAIWFVQAFPFEYRMIDYEEGSGLPLKHYQQALQRRSYTYGTHYLPHDAQAHQLATGRSIEEMMRSSGFRVQIVPDIGIVPGINAARTLFERCWFDGERCADGLQGLRHYRWAPIGALGQVKREPLHDWASNPSDAFRYFAVGIKAPPASAKPKPILKPAYVGAWS